jgi:HAD superfamily hydrolase (TIGR01509 family)
VIDAILWDNDGVLVNTEGLFFQSTREALARAGVELTQEIFLKHSLRLGRSAFDLLTGPSWTPEKVAALKNDRDEIYAQLLRIQDNVFPDAPTVLQQLKGKTRMAIVTSSQRKHFDIAHERSGLADFFEFVLAREDYGNTKPDPEPYRMALQRLKLPAERCLVVEDSERGLASALAAGLRCVVVPHELTQGCAFEGATAVFSSLTALPAFVARL